MTSEISFRKIVRENARGRKWLPFLVSVVGFLVLVIGYYFALGPYKAAYSVREYSVEYVLSAAEYYVGVKSGVMAVLAVCGSLLAGYSGFMWLHSQEQVDFYHSTAVRRNRLFSAIFTSGALQVLIPFIICDLLAVLLVPALRGVASWEIISIGLRGMALAILEFLSLYATVVLAVMLSSRIMTTIVMTAIFWIYGPILQMVLRGTCETFFDTLVFNSDDSLFWLSPVLLIMAVVVEEVPRYAGCLGILIYGVLSFALAMRVYRVRPSEAAGNAFPFRRESPIVKILILIPVSLGFGMILGTIASTGGSYYQNVNMFWAVFGVLFGGFLGHSVLELLFQPDFRNIKTHWKSGAIGTAATMAVFLFIALDPMRINLWIPDSSDVAAMSVDADTDEWLTADYTGYYPDVDPAFVTEYNALYELAQTCVGNRAAGKNVAEAGSDSTYVTIGYQMTNGRKAYRRYLIGQDEVNSALEKSSESEEFRRQYYVTAHLPENIEYLYVDTWEVGKRDPQGFALSADEAAKLTQALAEDSASQSLTQLMDQTPTATLTLVRGEETGDNLEYDMPYYGDLEIYLYPSYTNTNAVLEEIGIGWNRSSYVSMPLKADLVMQTEDSYSEWTISDPEAIDALLNMVLRQETRAQYYKYRDQSVTVTLYYAEEGSEVLNYLVLDKDVFDDMVYEFQTSDSETAVD